jgi:hypothetical protein
MLGVRWSKRRRRRRDPNQRARLTSNQRRCWQGHDQRSALADSWLSKHPSCEGWVQEVLAAASLLHKLSNTALGHHTPTNRETNRVLLSLRPGQSHALLRQGTSAQYKCSEGQALSSGNSSQRWQLRVTLGVTPRLRKRDRTANPDAKHKLGKCSSDINCYAPVLPKSEQGETKAKPIVYCIDGAQVSVFVGERIYDHSPRCCCCLHPP